MVPFTIASIAALALAGVQGGQDEFKWHGKVPSGGAIEIRGINGSIHAAGTSGGEVEVAAKKHARKSDPAEVEIKVVEHSRGVTICAIYPSRRASRPNECLPGGGGHNETRDNDVEVDFEVRVPAGVRLVGATVNGEVSAESLDADVEATTVNGGVIVSTRGLVEAATVNGSITATMGRADWKGPLEFTTVNGAITLTLPSGVGAELRAETVNGSIDSDFPVTVQGRVNPSRLRGTIGEGGRELSLTTVNGSIRLRKAS